MTAHIQLFICVFLLGLSRPTTAAPSLPFSTFSSQYLKKHSDTLRARRDLSAAERNKVRMTDQWQSRLTATPRLSFEEQSFGNIPTPISNRVSNIDGQFTQSMPTGTTFEISGQKFLELQNPIGQALDRRYSARISQDLFRNAFGKSQSARANKGRNDYEVSKLQFRQAIANSCEQAFTLYTDAYIQQEVAELLRSQFEDAKKAVAISRKLFKNKLINKVDKLTSESDFIDTQLQVQQAEQKLLNVKRQIQAFLDDSNTGPFSLKDPSPYLQKLPPPSAPETLNEVIVDKRIVSQDYEMERTKSERWTDIQLGLEVGETYGRTSFTGGLPVRFQEEYLRAQVTFGFDLINNTENAELKNAIYQKNSLVREQLVLEKTQKMRVQSLLEMNELLKSQVESSQRQVRLLEQKMKIAFGQMKRARLDFQNYLLHRNAYLNQQQSYLNLKKDLWLNQFALQKEYAHTTPALCETPS